MWALERLVTTWAEGAREPEIERVAGVLKDTLRGRGHNVPPCERKSKEEVGSRVLTRRLQYVERILGLRMARRDSRRS